MGEAAGFGCGKNQSSIFTLTQANLSLSALKCFILMCIQSVISELFKCIKAKSVSYITSTAFEEKMSTSTPYF